MPVRWMYALMVAHFWLYADGCMLLPHYPLPPPGFHLLTGLYPLILLSLASPPPPPPLCYHPSTAFARLLAWHWYGILMACTLFGYHNPQANPCFYP